MTSDDRLQIKFSLAARWETDSKNAGDEGSLSRHYFKRLKCGAALRRCGNAKERSNEAFARV